MRASPSQVTLLPEEPQQSAPLTGLPPDLLAQSARRLRALVLLYAFVFFMNNHFRAIVFADERAAFLASPLGWAPGTLSITAALLLAALTLSTRISVTTILGIGLVFEVIGSYGIAAAQYLDPARYAMSPPWGGLSWVAVWMLGFTMIIPSHPRRALAAALASASAVPVVVGSLVAAGRVSVPGGAARFFILLVLPYLLVVLIAYVGARIVYRIGTELTRARELGSYRLIERLGQGGMGEVWRAEHRLLARPAAIKLIRPEMIGGSSLERKEELRMRFEREAQATSLLRSPHTIELYDFGIADDGAFYYVMELLDGFDLETLVQRFGPVPPERAVYLLTQICHSLAEAHAQGLIHRDVKPANVYVCRHGLDVDFVKVLDFGLVKAQSEQIATSPSLTADHHPGGTPTFMSPEQVLGNRPLDGRSDVYAIGCVGYWLVTGQLVFTGTTAMEVMTQHAHAMPVPPSQRAAREMPAALDHAIMACLEKDPDKRPATASALAERLQRVEMSSAWTVERQREWWHTTRSLPAEQQ